MARDFKPKPTNLDVYAEGARRFECEKCKIVQSGPDLHDGTWHRGCPVSPAGRLRRKIKKP